MTDVGLQTAQENVLIGADEMSIGVEAHPAGEAVKLATGRSLSPSVCGAVASILSADPAVDLATATGLDLSPAEPATNVAYSGRDTVLSTAAPISPETETATTAVTTKGSALEHDTDRPIWSAWSYFAQKPDGPIDPSRLTLSITVDNECVSFSASLTYDVTRYPVVMESVDGTTWTAQVDISGVYLGVSYDLGYVAVTAGAGAWPTVIIGSDLVHLPAFGEGHQSGSGSQ